MNKKFVCKKCCKKAKTAYKNIGAYGLCDLCGEVGGITLIDSGVVKNERA